MVEESKSDPGFLERGGLRRRQRFLRKTRELAYRDLGGFVFEMHRLGQQREDLLKGKLATLERIDSELRAIEDALRERRGVTVLREAGVTACPRCAAIHGSEDRFCPACGFSMGRNAERPIAANPVATPATAQATAPGDIPPAQTSTAAPGQTTAPPARTNVAPAQTNAPPAQAPVASPAQTPAAAPARVSVATPTQAPAPASAPQPTEVIEPPTQIIRPGQSKRT